MSRPRDAAPETEHYEHKAATPAVDNATALSDGWIETYSGIQWRCSNPRPEDVRLADVFHGISLMCRFGGQVRAPYSVGQHSLYVAKLLHQRHGLALLTLHGLLHDGSEAYLSDIVRPLKHQIPQYLEIEELTQNAILTGLKVPPLPEQHQGLLKDADNAILLAERRDLFPNSKFTWSLNSVSPANITIQPTEDWKNVQRMLMSYYVELRKKI